MNLMGAAGHVKQTAAYIGKAEDLTKPVPQDIIPDELPTDGIPVGDGEDDEPIVITE